MYVRVKKLQFEKFEKYVIALPNIRVIDVNIIENTLSFIHRR